jgi:large subunit ribosomal protein L11
MMFCKEYNARTSDKKGTIIPVEISVFEDKSFTFILKTPPASELIKKAAKVQKGSGTPGGRGYVQAGSITMADVEEIAKIKLPDLNTNKVASAMNTVIGTAKNMGIVVSDAP